MYGAFVCLPCHALAWHVFVVRVSPVINYIFNLMCVLVLFDILLVPFQVFRLYAGFLGLLLLLLYRNSTLPIPWIIHLPSGFRWYEAVSQMTITISIEALLRAVKESSIL